jgi:XRE family transcriptional regulator, regulator of sulfur utilization
MAMAKRFAEYARDRRARMTADERELVNAFERAYALAGQLAEARRSRALTQRQLAAMSGVDQGDVSRIERGVLFPTTATLARLLTSLRAQLRIELLPADDQNSAAVPISGLSPSRHP